MLLCFTGIPGKMGPPGPMGPMGLKGMLFFNSLMTNQGMLKLCSDTYSKRTCPSDLIDGVCSG